MATVGPILLATAFSTAFAADSPLVGAWQLMKYSIVEMKHRPNGRMDVRLPSGAILTYRALYDNHRGRVVYESRDAALAFASDIAHGLLDYIERDLEKRLGQDKESIQSLESAMQHLKQQPSAEIAPK